MGKGLLETRVSGKKSLCYPTPRADKLGQMPIIHSTDIYCPSP